MQTGITIAGLVALTFASTNIDNLLLLTGWMLAEQMRLRAVFAGYLAGMLVVLAISYGLGLLGNLVPLHLIGWLGLLPIALGTRMLLALRHPGRAPQVIVAVSETGTVLLVALTQLSNGLDTALVFSPLLADTLDAYDVWIAGGYCLMTLLWFGLARLLAGQSRRLRVVVRASRLIAPLVMILVGSYIISNTLTDSLPG